jgi:hypothetical protein
MSTREIISEIKLKTANVVAVFSTLLIFTFLFLLLYVEIPRENKDIVTYLSVQIVTVLLGAIVWFLFNYKKDETTKEEDVK